jgi:hypothetical protein
VSFGVLGRFLFLLVLFFYLFSYKVSSLNSGFCIAWRREVVLIMDELGAHAAWGLLLMEFSS